MIEQNLHGKWRLEAARQIARRLQDFEGLRAIIVAGSVARGYADEYSDLEMPLFWDELPSDATRHAVVRALEADFLRPYNGPAQEDNLLINGFQVDLWQCTVPFEEDTLDDVLQRYTTDLGASNFMDTVRTCIPLAGEQLIANWKQRAGAYPEPLAIRNLQEQLPHFEIGHLMIHALRDNPALVYERISDMQQHLFLVLLALNHAYFPRPEVAISHHRSAAGAARAGRPAYEASLSTGAGSGCAGDDRPAGRDIGAGGAGLPTDRHRACAVRTHAAPGSTFSAGAVV